MNIKITSDSTCDLPKHLLEQYNITTFPLTIIKNGENFKDNVTITPADIFAHVAAGGNLCTTAACNPGDYQEIFGQYAQQYDGILHISLGSNFSCSYQNACLAAMEFDNVLVVDSQNLSTGQGHVVLRAVELAKTAESLDTLAKDLEAYSEKLESSFLVDKLDYLVKGGRCSSAAALGANLLNLKPCIEVKDGKMTVVKKYRGNYAKCLSNYVRDRLEGREDIALDTVFVTHSTISQECHNAVLDALENYGQFENIYDTFTGCTVSCHCGPGTLGILFVRK
jgi:DegV family protein with EDD domain